jgi:hypothetical protein
MKTVFFWAVMQRVVINPYRRFGATYRSLLQGLIIQDLWPFKMRPIGCPETSARTCHYSLRNTPQKSSSFLKTCSFRGKIPEVLAATKSSTNISRKYPRHIIKVDQSFRDWLCLHKKGSDRGANCKKKKSKDITLTITEFWRHSSQS